MKRVKYVLLFVAAVSLSSCGIVKKGCGCPHFGKIKTPETNHTAVRYA
ncbi:MAG TPA: hypothetical protein VHC47_14765 [Mucilaginibacter sp.]|nr:hypothetical protein [Mucilaginibacter sp.]